MGLKFLGVICAGVFVGAALMEIKQLGWRKRRERTGEDHHDDMDDWDDEDEQGDGATATDR